MSVQVSGAVTPTQTPSTNGDMDRRSANYHPSIWGDHFLRYASISVDPDSDVELRMRTSKAAVLQKLKNEAAQPLEKLILVDNTQRLGLAYHFEKEIMDVLNVFHKNIVQTNNVISIDQDNLYAVSLSFRLLRQQGFHVTSEMFENFRDRRGEFKAEITGDIKGLMSLYEASHFRLQGEAVLDKALEFSTKTLKLMLPHLKSPLIEEVQHCLETPILKGMSRLESRYYIQAYEKDPTHDNVLLELAKLDFNSLQRLHQAEISELTRWWRDIDFASKLSFARDRLVECYFWILGVQFEPKYSMSRKFLTKLIAIASVIDDIYDVYATIEELHLFTDTIERWDLEAADNLPEYMKVCYIALYNVVKEMEDYLISQGRSFRIHYAKEAMKGLVRAYYQEAIWFNSNYVPTFKEYLENATMSSGYPMLEVESLIGIGDETTKEALDWALDVPQIIRSSGLIARLVDDIRTHKVEQERGDNASGVQCYMRDYGVTEEEACKKIEEMVDVAWKTIIEEIQKPNHLPLQVLMPALNFGRMMEVLYQNGDGYTNSSGRTKERIESLLIDSIPI